jgi:hypothetical protein
MAAFFFERYTMKVHVVLSQSYKEGSLCILPVKAFTSRRDAVNFADKKNGTARIKEYYVASVTLEGATP